MAALETRGRGSAQTHALLLAVSMLVACAGAARAADPPSWPVQSVAAANAAYAAKQWAACAAQFQALAKRTSGVHARHALYNSACCHARDGNLRRALDMLDAAIAAGFRDVDALERDSDLASLH